MKHLISCAAITVLTLATASPASAAEWKLFRHLADTPNGGPGARSEYDAKSIKRTGSLVTVWERLVYDSPKRIDGILVSAMMTRYHYDCDAQTFFSGSIRAYNSSNEVVYSTDEKDTARPLDPSTDGYTKLKLFCVKARKAVISGA